MQVAFAKRPDPSIMMESVEYLAAFQYNFGNQYCNASRYLLRWYSMEIEAPVSSPHWRTAGWSKADRTICMTLHDGAER